MLVYLEEKNVGIVNIQENCSSYKRCIKETE